MSYTDTARLFIFAAAAALVLTASSCTKETHTVYQPQKSWPEEGNGYNDTPAKKYLRERVFKYYYFWNDEIRSKLSTVNPKNFDEFGYFDAMLYSKDRWSWMADKEAFASMTTRIITEGSWGVEFSQPVDDYGIYEIFVSMVYDGSPLARYGVTRGAEMTAIGGTDISYFDQKAKEAFTKGINVSPQTFSFRLADGRDTTFTASMSTDIVMNPVHLFRIIGPSDHEGLNEPVGYFNYLSFSDSFLQYIDEAMMFFRENDIHKLIVDLRYNSGGSSVSQTRITDYLAPEAATGETANTMKHNALLEKEGWNITSLIRSIKDAEGNDDTNYKSIGKEGSGKRYTIIDDVIVKPLNLDGLYFIIGESTASASEVVINSLKPYMDGMIHLVGKRSHGKPNGMYEMIYPDDDEVYDLYAKGDYSKIDFVFLPICFFNVNASKDYIPEEGFKPDFNCPDDILHDFGTEEANIKACLTHMATGKFAPDTQEPVTKAVAGQGARIELRRPDIPLYLTPMRHKPHKME